ncbi:MAG TPA: carboxymuconolactone decarboxylase family protein [Crenalkalicoccus sp.]|jgi:alkylhydroperoxidase family enzyme|nr:carboxymuconolactone decarboxylase family protein [Crenalkalicoccus sp.]
MARLPYLDPTALAPEHRPLLARNIHLHRLLAHNPEALGAFGVLGQYLRHGTALDPRLRELAILQIGWCARSAYEWSHHVKIGLGFGVTEADIEGMIAESEGRPSPLEPLARQVLRAAREAYAGAVGEASFAALRPALGEAALVDLVLAASFYCAVVRILASLAIEVEEEYLPYLRRFPLPAEPWLPA